MTDPYCWLVLAPVIGLAVDVAVHVLASWVTRSRNVYRCILLGFLAGLGLTVAVSIGALVRMGVGPADFTALLVFNLIISAALAYGYFNFINLNLTSLRIQTLHELLAAPAGLTREELLGQYSARTVVENRIARLTRAGQWDRKDGRFYTRPSSFLALARVLGMMRFLILGRRRQRPTSGGE